MSYKKIPGQISKFLCILDGKIHRIDNNINTLLFLPGVHIVDFDFSPEFVQDQSLYILGWEESSKQLFIAICQILLYEIRLTQKIFWTLWNEKPTVGCLSFIDNHVFAGFPSKSDNLSKSLNNISGKVICIKPNKQGRQLQRFESPICSACDVYGYYDVPSSNIFNNLNDKLYLNIIYGYSVVNPKRIYKKDNRIYVNDDGIIKTIDDKGKLIPIVTF